MQCGRRATFSYIYVAPKLFRTSLAADAPVRWAAMDDEKVICSEHGEQQTTFVCHHLVTSLETGERVGFCWSPNPDNPRGDAWCIGCDEYLDNHGGEWNDTTMAFADIKILCGACYDQVKELNGF